jgi:hypothetical protein
MIIMGFMATHELPLQKTVSWRGNNVVLRVDHVSFLAMFRVDWKKQDIGANDVVRNAAQQIELFHDPSNPGLL